MIDEGDVERVRVAVDLVDLISEHAQVRKVGRRWTTLCPFHTEKTGSFSINREDGLYHCFGCGASGDVISYVCERERVGFVAAVERLAARAGVTLRYTDPDETVRRQHRHSLHAAVAAAVGWYHQRLLSGPDAEPARRYLTDRGITGDQIDRYQIGWAPAGWDDLARALRLPPAVFVDAGLGFRNKGGRLTDSFRARVLFPIYDAEDRPVGFGGRVLPGADGPKYKNSGESQVYAKSRILYGLNWARADVVATGTVVVCEGYTDVLGFAAAGIPTAVATCGTALTDDHLKILAGYAKRIVLAFDADTAGLGAAGKVYDWEQRHRVDVAVARLPAGVDPADLARTDPAALAAAVDDARPFLGFRIGRLLDTADLTSPEGRARAARLVLAAAAEHPDPLVRDQYLMDVASRTRIDPDLLRADLPRPEPRPSTGRPPERRRVRPVPPVEVEALRLIALGVAPMGLLHGGLFADPRARAAFELLAAGDVRRALNAADGTVERLLRRVVVEDSDADPVDVVDLLLRAATERAINRQLAGLAGDPENPVLFAGYAQEVSAVKLQVESLGDHADPAEQAAARQALVDWLRPDPAATADR